MRSQLTPFETAEVERVDALANQLARHLHSSAEIIAALHIYGAQSKAIQGRTSTSTSATDAA